MDVYQPIDGLTESECRIIHFLNKGWTIWHPRGCRTSLVCPPASDTGHAAFKVQNITLNHLEEKGMIEMQEETNGDVTAHLKEL